MRSLRRSAAGPVAVVAALVLSSCTGGADAGGSGNRDAAAVKDGTITFGADQEPAIMNSWLTEGNLQATHSLTLPVLYPLWRVTPDFEYEPLLLEGQPEVSRDPFTVTYKLKDEAEWSDGKPITARDIQFTLETCLDPKYDIAVREGCNKVDMGASQIVDSKTFKMVFKEPYAPWKSMFSNATSAILPAHVLEGKNFNKVWNDGPTVASGPMKFEKWNRGQNLTLVRNENFWGDRKPGLKKIVFRFLEESTSQVQALRGGEIDVLSSQAQLDLVEQVGEIDGVTSKAVAGGVWEFFEFNWGVKGLGEDYGFVREAIAHGIDRKALVKELIKPMNPDAEPLNSVVYMNNQDEYQPAFDKWDYDPEKAKSLLDRHGCKPGSDGIRVCDGVRLSFDFGYTSGNELRELQFVVLQQQLKEIGIELKDASEEASSYFGDTWPAGEQGAWELFDQAWLGSADPQQSLGFWECDGELNYRSYCNREVHKLIQKSKTELDQKRRTAMLNRVNELLADDLPVMPLYQKPTFLAWDSHLEGPQPNPTEWGHLWNVEEWRPAK